MAYRAGRGGEGWRRGEVMSRWAEAVQAVLLRRCRSTGRRIHGRVRSGRPPARARTPGAPQLPLLWMRRRRPARARPAAGGAGRREADA